MSRFRRCDGGRVQLTLGEPAGQFGRAQVASFDGDIVLIPIGRADEALELLRRAGHHVIG